jgi:fumarate hydratase subunit alpha
MFTGAKKVFMREIQASDITETVSRLCKEANFMLGEDVYAAIESGIAREESPIGREILGELLENAQIARTERVPMCQDTGFAVVFLEIGQDVHIAGGYLEDAVNAGVAQGYDEGFLRKSIVRHPLDRVNTGDNTPAVIHTRVVPGEKIRIVVAPKGGGSENMSAVRMLKPSDGMDGVADFVLETVKKAGPNPCPPIIVGVGMGGTMEIAAFLAKKSLLREVGSRNRNPEDAELESKLLHMINKTGIGPAGLGGRVTALAVNIEAYPCHIASLPVAVNIQCHAARHREAVL